MDDEIHKETIDAWKTKVVVQVMMPNDHLKQDQHNQKKELKQCDHTDANKKNQVSNNDTFHDVIQVEDVIDDTYDDNNNVNRKPINKKVIDDTNNDDNNDWKLINNGFLQPVGKQKGATGMMHEYEVVVCQVFDARPA